jgi:extracellular elastinolytic metalloproteinase
MHHDDGRRRDRRRATVAVLTTAMTLAAVLAVTAPARSAGRVVARHVIASRAGGTFDVRTQGGAAVAPSARTARARIQLARRLGAQGVMRSDPLTGTLGMVGRLDGFLTARSTRPARTVAMAFVRSNLAAFGLSRADMKTFRLRQDYVDIRGTHHISWTQSQHGVTVFHNGLRANVTKDGRLINLTGSPVHALRAPSYRPTVSSSFAMRVARATTGADARGTRSDDDATLVLFPTGRGARLAWRTFTWASTQELDLSVVDAATGALLYRQNLTNRDAAAPPPPPVTGTASAWEFYPSDQVPVGANIQQPVSFQVEPTDEAPQLGLFGPNALVWDDLNDNNKPDPSELLQPLSGTDWSQAAILDSTNAAQNCNTAHPCTWDAAVPFSWQANALQNAAQVFYYLNKYHDHLAGAPYGFTEAAGNFQLTNASGQGKGDDPVLGNALDGANTDSGLPDKNHFDNANMSAPPDGRSPTMQMYLFHATQGLELVPSANGGDDAEVVYHEYTHGLTNRLVLYPDGTSGLTTQQSNSMGEGWSDWYADDFLNNEGFKPDTAVIGDVVIGAITFAGQLRFDAVDCSVDAVAATCPGGAHTGAGGFTYGDFGKVSGAGPEVHSDGEIWLQTLWQIRQTLGAPTSETLVTRALELSPPAPSYLDMRNAILQADLVNFGGANATALWTIFANRGMGFFASASDGSDITPTEDFSTPPDCATSTCVTLTGRITDKQTGKPAKGVEVGVAGLNSGFGFDLADTTDASGHFSIANMPVHTYPEIRLAGGGYEPIDLKHFSVTANTTLDRTMVRDWASTEGGATVGKFTPPDYGPFGCGPAQMLDLNVETGWGSDAVKSTSGSHHKGPRKAVVKLPKAVRITSFALASSGSCGDAPPAGVKDFEIRTKGANGSWTTVVTDVAPNDGKLHVYIPHGGGLSHVRYVQLVMLSNHGDKLFMDVLELLVRGR